MRILPLLCWLPVALAAAQPTSAISGTVYGGSGITIPNPQVLIRDIASGHAVQVTGDYAGRYTAEGLMGGRFRISVPAFPGFAEVEANPRPGETLVVDLHIRPLVIDPQFAKPRAITMAELAHLQEPGVAVHEVTDYAFGGYQGAFTSPPSADLNPRHAYVITWKGHPYRFVFAHEGSYCPWFELPSGAGLSYQFFEGNAGWAELFNEWGRKERNSFVDVLEAGPDRVWVRWTYIAVNMKAGEAAYRGTEDFWAYPNGLILRRQTYQTLRPGDPHGHAREPIEMIAMSPVGKLWFDVLAPGAEAGESHSLAVLDTFSSRRYDVYWKRAPGRIWSATARRSGDPWQQLDDARGVALVVPMRDGAPFCIFGDASGFRHDFTRIKEHSHKDTGGIGWVSNSWDHWPVGWMNSQAHDVDAESVKRLPNHFSPAGMDFFALPNEESERGVFYSLIGIGGRDLEDVRRIGRVWLESEVGPQHPPRRP